MFSKVIFLTLSIVSVLTSAPMEQKLTVRLYNHSSVDAPTLSKARAVATRILMLAAVDLSWIDCTSPETERDKSCGRSAGDGEVIVRVIDHKRVARPFGGDVLGSTLLEGYVTVYATGVEHVSTMANVSQSTVFGLTMAHELGHVLLGDGVHSPRGIMAERWTRSEIESAQDGKLLFTSFEQRRMREREEARGFAAMARGAIAPAK